MSLTTNTFRFATHDPVELARWELTLKAEGIFYTHQTIIADNCKPFYILMFDADEYRLPFQFCHMLME